MHLDKVFWLSFVSISITFQDVAESSGIEIEDISVEENDDDYEDELYEVIKSIIDLNNEDDDSDDEEYEDGGLDISGLLRFKVHVSEKASSLLLPYLFDAAADLRSKKYEMKR
jgi:hypothetical protein